jgi:hypothetical protein
LDLESLFLMQLAVLALRRWEGYSVTASDLSAGAVEKLQQELDARG